MSRKHPSSISPTSPPLAAACFLSGLIALPDPAAAQTTSAPDVVVTATRIEEKAFDLPVAIDVVSADEIQSQQLQVNVSETLNRVPGTNVQSKETYSQEQQITIRGFGARSQFGVRGIKLLADGIPASMPDGQGGSGLFDLSSAQRIEVLRGPFSALYGNHSGGVVQVFTEDGPARPTVTASFAAGSHDTTRSGVKFGGQSGGVNFVGSASHFSTDGYRDHSAAQKDQFNAKLRSADDNASFTIVLNHFVQKDNEDPLGLTAQQVAEDRRQAQTGNAFSGNAEKFNTHRNLTNSQVGFIYETAVSEMDSVRAIVYGGTRNNEQYLAFTSNGVSKIDREFAGSGLRWTRKTSAWTVTGGVDYEHAADLRQGFANNSGVKGSLGRDELNTVYQTGAYAQAEWKTTANVSLTGGLRYTRVGFDSDDRFLGNGDNSGEAVHSAWTPVVGGVWKLSPAVNLYANAGRSFETPTAIEVANRPDGAAGMNFELKPSTSKHYEVGVKAFVGTETRVNVSAFQIEGSNEIVIATNAQGRATYQNAGDTQRRGLELALESNLGGGFSTYLSATWLEAKFKAGFDSCSGVTPPCTSGNMVTIDAGNRIPGVPNYNVFGELAWRHAPLGFTAAGEVRRNGKVQVNDTNTASAEAYTVASLRGGFEQRSGNWRFSEFARVDNVFDEEYIGAVYVNDANGRFYAPAPERGYLLGASASYSF